MKMHHHAQGAGHEHSITEELVCHVPYAIFSVAFSIMVLSFVSYFSFGDSVEILCHKSEQLFHSFHFMHIVFAATGTLISFFRFSKNMVRALILGVVSPMVFCTLSDSVLPYLAGQLLGVHMHFHLCFVSHIFNVVPFLIAGIINGFAMSRHYGDRQLFYAVSSHAIHILVSSLASMFYLVAHGCTDWYRIIGIVFIFLIIAVIIPCTLSDVVVPMLFARVGSKK